MNVSDLTADLGLLAGKEGQQNPEVDAIMDTFDELNVHYSVGAHSLATTYVYNALAEHGKNIDDIYMYNASSSPFQSNEFLTKEANDPRITYFLNEGDMVSAGLYQKMNQDTLDNRVYIGEYRWSPLSSHSLTQWYDEVADEPKEEPDETPGRKLAEDDIPEVGETRSFGTQNWRVNFTAVDLGKR